MADWLLTLFPEAYTAIDEYGKNVEGRAPDPSKPEKNYALLKPGDRVVFRAIDSHDFKPLGLPDMVFPVTFNHLYTGATAEEAIEAMLETEGLENLLPGCESVEDGIEVYMNLPGYAKRIAEHGINAIGLGERVS